MIILEAKTPILLFRYKSYKHHDFIYSHNSLCQQNGYVWMMKAGIKTRVEKIKKVMNYGGWMILRSPKGEGGTSYLAHFTEYSDSIPPDGIYPSYYKDIFAEENDEVFSMHTEYQWFRLTKIHPLTEEQMSVIVLSMSQAPIDNVIKSTRTAVMFVENRTQIIIEE